MTISSIDELSLYQNENSVKCDCPIIKLRVDQNCEENSKMLNQLSTVTPFFPRILFLINELFKVTSECFTSYM